MKKRRVETTAARGRVNRYTTVIEFVLTASEGEKDGDRERERLA